MAKHTGMDTLYSNKTGDRYIYIQALKFLSEAQISDTALVLPVLFLITMAATAPATNTPRRISPAMIPMMGVVGDGGGSGRESSRG